MIRCDADGHDDVVSAAVADADALQGTTGYHGVPRGYHGSTTRYRGAPAGTKWVPRGYHGVRRDTSRY